MQINWHLYHEKQAWADTGAPADKRLLRNSHDGIHFECIVQSLVLLVFACAGSQPWHWRCWPIRTGVADHGGASAATTPATEATAASFLQNEKLYHCQRTVHCTYGWRIIRTRFEGGIPVVLKATDAPRIVAPSTRRKSTARTWWRRWPNGLRTERSWTKMPSQMIRIFFQKTVVLWRIHRSMFLR